MKNKIFLLLFTLTITVLHAQRGIRIGYIDTEYILEKIPEYQQALTQLNTKAEKWKGKVEIKLTEIERKRKNLSNEKTLLTDELYAEREEDIAFEEKEVLDYQQKRFGPNGDLFIQQKHLMQPIQDQIFSAVQDIATKKKYDFIFDKSSDAVMLFSAKQHDLSDQIIRTITRAAKRKQAQSRAEKKEAKEESIIPEDNSDKDEREKLLEEKRLEREKAIEKARQDKLDAREARIKAAQEKRQKILEEREKLKQQREEKLEGNNQPKDSTSSENSKAENDDTKKID